MKQTTVNEFKDGLNLDLHPLVTPKTVLTDNINGTFITYNGNEFCLQNDRGNKYVSSLTPGYTPIGIKEHNGILYIVSVNGDVTEIGTFPSPEYENIDLEEAYSKEWSGDLKKTYAPLHVLEGHEPLTNINLGYTTKTPVTIEIQDSYDGSVNLILVADECKPRIINSGFSVLPDDKYKFINRKQDVATNVYDDVNKESELIRTSDILTNIDLLSVQAGGQFKGGNYTFYIKFGDGDFNQTDVVAESGIVSVFNGNNGVSSTISGTLLDERTDKMIQLRIQGLNHVYSKIYVYYSREYSDTQGYRMTEYGMFKEPIDMEPFTKIPDFDEHGHTIWNKIPSEYQDIWLTGFEQMIPIEPELLNIDYHTIDWARAEAQHSNMLFLGNVGQKETFELYRELDNITKNVIVSVNQSSLPALSTYYVDGPEYYDVNNIYERVGYYPGEIYRFGIVYILKDGSKTPVFNMNGKNFQTGETISDGVFLMPKVDVICENEIKPIYLNFRLPEITNDNVLGWFVVRQKRIPNTICEGLNIAIDKKSNIPVIWDGSHWITQSFLDATRGDALNRNIELKTWKESRNVQLKYDNCGFSSTIFDESEFINWLNEKHCEFVNSYLVPISSDNWGSFVFNGTISDSDSLESKLQQVVRNLADQCKSIHEETATWNYSHVFIPYTEDSVQIENAENLLNEIRNGQSCKILWLRLYNLDSVDEHGVPTDVATDNYAVALYNPGVIINYENFTLGNENLNKALLKNWKRVYQSYINPTGMYNKTLEEWDCIDYWKEANALLSLDPCVNSSVSSILDGSKFDISLEREITIDPQECILYRAETFNTNTDFNINDVKCVFVPSNTGVKVVDGYEFSNIAGNASSVERFKYFTFPDGIFEGEGDNSRKDKFNNLKAAIDNPNVSSLTPEQEDDLEFIYKTNLNINLIRGLFTPYIGLANKDRIPNGIYSIKHKASLGANDFLVRQQDQSEYYAISPYLYLSQNDVNVFRGDCFTNTVTMRIIRSFIDSTSPTSDVIVDSNGWADWVINKDINSTTMDASRTDGSGFVRYDQVNVSDVNTVDLGLWVTFKCLSSYNLGLRSLDTFHTDEMALMGGPRTFHPLNSASTSTGYKMEESFLLNDGLSATVGRKRYNLFPDVPYSKSEFANRIMFSNVHITDAFTNGYRTFQGLSYKDYDKQYGAITKMIPLGQNIFVVMEHGLGLVPVNPKALMQTTTGEAIHIYGYGVLPDEMTIISQDYGSKYEHSVIRTPIGIYGMDVDAKKIWRFSDKQGFQTISDMKIETYLNDYLKQVSVDIGLKDVRAHYNGRKGDIMFTFYDENDSIKNINEVDYFNIESRNITLNVGNVKIIKCYTNLSDDDIIFTNSNNLECSYSNKKLYIEGLTKGNGEIDINGIHIAVNILEEPISVPDDADIPEEPDPDVNGWRKIENGIYVYPKQVNVNTTKGKNITFYVKFEDGTDDLWYADWSIPVGGPIYWTQRPNVGENNATVFGGKVGTGSITLMIRDKNHPDDKTHESDLKWVNWSITIKDNTPEYPDEGGNSQDKSLYFNIRQINTLRGMRASLPVYLKYPNGRPTSSGSNAAIYSADKMVSVESKNKSVIDIPSDNHVSNSILYAQCDNYTLPTIVHISEKCFKNNGTAEIRVYNNDKTIYDSCIVNVLDTNPEGSNVSQFEQNNLVWPFEIYVNKNSYFDVWTHHHLRHNQVVTIDDPTAISEVENGYMLQDKVTSEGTNVKLLYSSRQFKTGNKSGTYHISFTCPATQYYNYSGTYTVTVHII